ncbi:MAG: glycosyltransferase 61 family protein [Rhodospirillales bacterium]
MILLTWHGTVLRIDAANATVIHAALWPAPAGANDLLLDAPAAISQPLALAGLPGVTLVGGARPGIAHLRRGEAYLRADPAEQITTFTGDEPGPWESFLLVDERAAAHLRHILAQAWTLEGAAAETAPTAISLTEGFQLELGALRIDLAEQMPRPVAPPPPAVDAAGSAGEHGMPDRFSLSAAEGPVVISRAPGALRHEFLLRRLPRHLRPPEAASEAEFRATPNRLLALPGTPEILTPPITICAADRAWCFEKPWENHVPMVGRHTLRSTILRESDKLVLLARYAEGMVFDEHGVSNEFGYLEGLPRHTRHTLPGFLRFEGERILFDRAAAAAAPTLPGPYVVFYGGNLTNYCHWMIDAMLPLHVMLPYLPQNARLLLPGTLRGLRDSPERICDHHDILRAFGFAALPAVEISDSLCRVEEIYWLDHTYLQWMPALFMRALRDHVLGLRAPAGPRDKRIYVARRGSRKVTNAAGVEQFVTNQGFTRYFLEDFSIDEQIELFRHAEWVIGPHGAELGNLLFCAPGTRVLELSPDADFRQYFSLMSNKLGLVHGVLPCPTDHRGFFGDMTVDIPKLRALFRTLSLQL